MKYTEKIFQRLVEFHDSCYKERLIESAEVREYFLIIVQQVKKFTKPEIKKQVDDFEMKVTMAGQPTLEVGGAVGGLASGTNTLSRASI